jgi:hypothetical protein
MRRQLTAGDTIPKLGGLEQIDLLRIGFASAATLSDLDGEVV